MFEKLKEIEKNYEGYNLELQDPEVLKDSKKIKEISQKASNIEDVVFKYREYKKLMDEKDLAKEMLQDSEMKDLGHEELERIKKAEKVFVEELERLLIPKDPRDNKNIIVEIRGAAGGDEANIFAGDLARMYLQYAKEEGWHTEIIEEERNDNGGYSYISFSVKGKKVYSKLKYESGAHRVQRIPTTETQGRVHTSTATVLVMPEVEEFEIDIKPGDLKIDIYRAGGAGGQHVNTTDSAVRITHIPTGIIVTCQNERSQLQNREKAMQVLRARVYEAEEEKRNKERGEERKNKIGTGDRSEKIRTYNYPQNRVTDHRIGFTTRNLDRVMEGKLYEIIEALIKEDELRAMSCQ